jgi:hypothetical protein
MNSLEPAGRHGVWTGDGRRNEFRSNWQGGTGSGQAMGRRKSSPKFISAWVWADDGQA